MLSFVKFLWQGCLNFLAKTKFSKISRERKSAFFSGSFHFSFLSLSHSDIDCSCSLSHIFHSFLCMVGVTGAASPFRHLPPVLWASKATQNLCSPRQGKGNTRSVSDFNAGDISVVNQVVCQVSAYAEHFLKLSYRDNIWVIREHHLVKLF